MIYLNNAATSFPKPRSVISAVSYALSSPPQEPGRTGIGQKNVIDDCRLELTRLFSVPSPQQISLSFGATYCLNQVIQGLFLNQNGGHVLATQLEHNSVIRPLEHLRLAGKITVDYLAPNSNGIIEASNVLKATKANTQLICVNHASNVTGNIQPIEEIAVIAAKNNISLLIDASQTAGAVDLCYKKLPGRVFVVFAGHKGLYGPTGTGAMIVPDDKLPQTFVGGTGIRSELLVHPLELPLRNEAGTPNFSGLAGLTEGVRFVLRKGVASLGGHRKKLVISLREKLNNIGGICLSPLANNDGRAGVISFNLRGWTPMELGAILRDAFDIETRDGLHCAPMAHNGLGCFAEMHRQGSIRVSFSHFNTEEDVLSLVGAIASVKQS